jgi:uncharacterized protein YbbK (DUF523 family)
MRLTTSDKAGLTLCKKKAIVSACLLGEMVRYDDMPREKCPEWAFSTDKVS